MTVRTIPTRLLTALAVAMIAVACGGGDAPATPAATATSVLPAAAVDPTTTPEVSQISPYALPTRDVPFEVQLPAGTTAPVSVRVFGVTESEIARSVELVEADDGAWTASVPLEEGALIRYTYDRGDLDDLASLTARREAPALGFDTTWRIIHVAPELSEVRDTVAMWADQRVPAAVGSVSGVVTDAVTGLPVMDAEVSVGGMHTATDFDGRYRVNGLAAGDHVVTVHRVTGDYKASSTPVTVPADAEVTTPIDVEPARRITVQIQAIIPEDLPEGATVKIYGNSWQTGAQFETAPGQPAGLRLPVGHAARGREGERVQFALDLHDGQAVSYRYTLAGPGLSEEHRLDGDQSPRSFIASRANRVRVDEIEAFRPDGFTEVVLRAAVPANTPDDVPLQFVADTGHWMTADDTGAWSTVVYGRPGDALTYALRLGDDAQAGADASADTSDGQRTFEFPEADIAIDVDVTDWVGLPGVAALAEDELAEVEFRISVPASTTNGIETMLLVGNRELSDGVELTVVAGHPTLYVGSATLPAGRYSYDIQREPAEDGEEAPISAEARTLDVWLAQHTVNDWVAGWSGEIPNIQPRETRFQGGYQTADAWTPGLTTVTGPTFSFIEDRSGDIVSLPSAWSYGQVRPEPVVESRASIAPSGATPLEGLQELAAAARRNGLPVILAPRFTAEFASDGASLPGAKSQQWIDAWLVEAERLWLWNAYAADAINADILVLPGPGGQTFDQVGWFPSQDSFEDFDAALVALIAEVREQYDGQILVHGGQTALEAPGSADLVGVTTVDIGHPALSPFATTDQWRAAYDALFTSRLDPIHEAWEAPVFFYGLQVPSTPSAGDPTGELAQARQLEGLLQSLANRTWVVGAVSTSYGSIDAPELAGDGVRGRLAEAVLSKHYQLFNPADVSALTLG